MPRWYEQLSELAISVATLDHLFTPASNRRLCLLIIDVIERALYSWYQKHGGTALGHAAYSKHYQLLQQHRQLAESATSKRDLANLRRKLLKWKIKFLDDSSTADVIFPENLVDMHYFLASIPEDEQLPRPTSMAAAPPLPQMQFLGAQRSSASAQPTSNIPPSTRPFQRQRAVSAFARGPTPLPHETPSAPLGQSWGGPGLGPPPRARRPSQVAGDARLAAGFRPSHVNHPSITSMGSTVYPGSTRPSMDRTSHRSSTDSGDARSSAQFRPGHGHHPSLSSTGGNMLLQGDVRSGRSSASSRETLHPFPPGSPHGYGYGHHYAPPTLLYAPGHIPAASMFEFPRNPSTADEALAMDMQRRELDEADPYRPGPSTQRRWDDDDDEEEDEEEQYTRKGGVARGQGSYWDSRGWRGPGGGSGSGSGGAGSGGALY